MFSLLLDVGNTRVKAGWVGPSGRESDALACPHADLEQGLPPWLQHLPGPITQVLGVNVAGAVLASRLDALLTTHGLPAVRWQVPGTRLLGLRNGYQYPERLGADRWLGLVGLHAHARWRELPSASGPRLLATFGTATTIDLLTPEAGFVGGLILPGVGMMRSSLAGGTANLPLAEGASADFPRETGSAIMSGVCAAQAGAVLRQVLRVQAHHGVAPTLFVSGGAWPDVANDVTTLLAPWCGAPQWLAAPVLDGLACVATQPEPTPCA